MILGCNAQSKEKFWNPIPIAHVFRIVQASAAPEADRESEAEDENDEIVNYKPVSHSKSDGKGDLANPPKIQIIMYNWIVDVCYSISYLPSH